MPPPLPPVPAAVTAAITDPLSLCPEFPPQGLWERLPAIQRESQHFLTFGILPFPIPAGMSHPPFLWGFPPWVILGSRFSLHSGRAVTPPVLAAGSDPNPKNRRDWECFGGTGGMRPCRVLNPSPSHSSPLSPALVVILVLLGLVSILILILTGGGRIWDLEDLQALHGAGIWDLGFGIWRSRDLGFGVWDLKDLRAPHGASRVSAVFVVFSFVSAVDLIIALEEDGLVSGFTELYVRERSASPRGALRSLSPEQVAEEQRKPLYQRPQDLLLILILILTAAFTFFRGMVVLDCPADSCFDYTHLHEPYLRDPVAYPKVQMLIYLFYLLPFLILAIYALALPGCSWLPDWSLVFAGAVAQAQFTHLGSSLHSRTPFPYQTPDDVLGSFLLSNVLYALGPQLLALRCLHSPAFFLPPNPPGLARAKKYQ
ncbi:PREDICTED: transmembrane 6 superfamily member 2 [Corvus brachyrhynchos]|uniref:transmembrane 6 superfamily member 2 n=1 Tax=Corvus brachyrhynchos TaxID=85066 RepID=UPI00081664DC|nr:PREDICTED: transmembrane 6 superfamily member 2 [Corvus brachyrhynchos]